MPVLPSARPLSRLCCHPLLPQPRSRVRPPSSFRLDPCRRRGFVSAPWESGPQRVSATKTLSYPSAALYSIIADVGSYSAFLPYCTASRITRWSGPDYEGRRWPREAEMRVGWAVYEEAIVSKVYCVPGKVLEAVTGVAERTVPDEDLPHHTSDDGHGHGHGHGHSHDAAGSDPPRPEDLRAPSAPANDTSLFKRLYTRWTIRPFPYKPPPETESAPHGSTTAAPPPIEQTDVNLTIEFQFANPFYATLSKAAMPQVASIIIAAFEKRAQALLGKPRDGSEAVKPAAFDGLLGGRQMGQKP
ncbi:MAG: hypothetical protein M1826_004753 [Phylliscum demangeonii]|nr:MAG: hypothetical protein M1826_004753 [Phylliscum demangeonii]